MFRGPGRWFEIKEKWITEAIEVNGNDLGWWDVTDEMRQFIKNEYRLAGWQVQISSRNAGTFWRFCSPANMKSLGIV
jgi:hypothetical protein